VKKVLYGAFIAIFGLSTLFMIAPLVEAESADASCTAVGEFTYELVGQNAPDEQTFTPTFNKFTRADFIWGGSVGGDKSIIITLFNSIGVEVGSGTLMPTIGGKTVRTWQPATPISVRTGAKYTLRVENPGGATLYWYTADGGCYSGGNARQSGSDMGFDFGFTTYGYNEETSTPTPTPAPGSSSTPATDSSTDLASQPGVSAGSGETPATVTSSSIAPPTNLTAKDYENDKGGAVQLEWKASTTTDITGYKVFRSTDKTKGFKEVAKTDKKTLKFIDNGLENNKSYFYFVRTYKDKSESASSNTVEGKAIDNSVTSPTATVTASAVETYTLGTEADNTWYLIGALLILLALLIISWILWKKGIIFNKKKTSNQLL